MADLVGDYYIMSSEDEDIFNLRDAGGGHSLRIKRDREGRITIYVDDNGAMLSDDAAKELRDFLQ